VTVSAEAAAPRPVPGVSNLGLQLGERISVIDLLYALLLQSANDVAVALAEHVSGSVPAFVAAMNAEARELGARNTMFTSPNGLADSGYSTAADLATITRAAYALPLFAKIASTRSREIPPPGPEGDPRLIQNRNVLLWLYPGAIGAKTGFTAAAGFCVVAVAERDGRRTVAVVLGSAGEPFSDAATLLNYGFDGFQEQTLVGQGESFGTVPIQGRDVPVEATASLEMLVPVETGISKEVEVDPGLKFPPTVGEQVARLAVSAEGTVLGRVPLVVSTVPAPAQPPSGAWWSRATGATVRAVSGLLHALFG
jgi:D-alanyl-D-alanine carboxypeptidase (penicillin-binding protein 5/6)